MPIATAVDRERRDFLKIAVVVGAAAGGGFLVSFGRADDAPNTGAAPATPAAPPPSAFIRIDADGAITLIMPKVEMGQGTYTAHAMLLAEELEVGLDQIRLEASPPSDALYGDAINDGVQMTGTSTAIRYGWEPLRRAGALARWLLIDAAARRWNVAFESCHAQRGEVVHAPSGRRLSYGRLAGVVAKSPPARAPSWDHIQLKAAADCKLIGTSVARLDTPDKVNGRARYGIDADVAGMKFAAVRSSPVVGGVLGAVDDAAARAIDGVRQVVRLDDAVAVIADHTWAARQGLAALRVQWRDGADAHVSSAQLWRELDEAALRGGAVARNDGHVEDALHTAKTRLQATYRQSFLAHAAMEPMNCTVHLRADHCDIWVGTQVPSMAQAIAAKITGLPLEKIEIHNHLIGGSFGRRLEVDGIALALRVAQHTSDPIKLIWSREEDMQRSVYRPIYQDRLSAGLDADGRPISWSHRICGSAVSARYAPADMKNGVDPDTVESAIDAPYDLPNIRVEFVQHEPRGIVTGWWRGVGPTRSTFVVESFIDELAAAVKADPVSYRRRLLANAPRAKAVLDLAAQRSNWGAALPSRQGRGVALLSGFGSFLCAVAQVAVAADGSVGVYRVDCAVDCGVVVNPDIVMAQIEGGLIFGITAALWSEITLRDGRIEQSNFNDYRVMRINEAPRIDVHLVKSVETPGGIGETGTAVVAAAITNAIFAATGVRVRELPIRRAALGTS
jgi:isoquinoline 1-oxidoreductase subunit beta